MTARFTSYSLRYIHFITTQNCTNTQKCEERINHYRPNTLHVAWALKKTPSTYWLSDMTVYPLDLFLPFLIQQLSRGWKRHARLLPVPVSSACQLYKISWFIQNLSSLFLNELSDGALTTSDGRHYVDNSAAKNVFSSHNDTWCLPVYYVYRK